MLLFIGWIRKTSTQLIDVAQLAPGPVIFQTLPRPVVPSPVQRLPDLSKASPFVPGTPEANGAVGLLALEPATPAQTGELESSETQPLGSGMTFQILAASPPSAM